MRLMHFTANWCQPCKMMKPMIESIVSDRNDIEYIVVDVDENVETAQNYEIRSIPTFILFNGEEAVRVTGAMNRDKFLESLGLK
jgi:thioredoxin 1